MKEKFAKIPIAEAVAVPERGGTYQIYKNYYWAVTDDNELLVYRGFSVQANSNCKIVEHLIAGPDHPGKRVEFVETVFLPHNCRDYT